jgi:hypothetical protein
MFAHISGVPVEESLPWLVPIGGLGIAGSLAWARERTRAARQRFASEPKDPAPRCADERRP